MIQNVTMKAKDTVFAKVEEIQQEEKKHNGNDIFHIKEKIYEMILYGNPQLKDFPKAERYVLAGDIRKTKQIAKVKAGEERKDRLDRSVASYRGILSHCDSYGLRQSLNTMFKENGMVEKKQ